jgi:sterol desaturase/sphingolipid hydroxylase (fatty acid hydroxylase superfamily)
LQTAYLASLAGFLAFFAFWEGGNPRVPFGSASERFRHLARNGALFALIFVLTNVAAPLAGPELERWSVPVHSWLPEHPALALPLQAMCGVLLLDFIGYAWHRLSHRVPWLWRLHRVHHGDPHLDFSTALRVHPFEAILNLLVKLGLLTLVGLPPWVEGVRSILHNPLAFAQHANVRFPGWVERRGRWLAMTPGLHRLHHSVDPRDYDLNYGEIFSWWDRLFGTYRAPVAEIEAVGLKGYETPRWQSLGGMLAGPFRAAPMTGPG